MNTCCLGFFIYRKTCGFLTRMNSQCHTVRKELLTGVVKRFIPVSRREVSLVTVLVSCRESQSFHSLTQLGASWYIPLQGMCCRKYCQLCCTFLNNDNEGLQTDIIKGMFLKRICGFTSLVSRVHIGTAQQVPLQSLPVEFFKIDENNLKKKKLLHRSKTLYIPSNP